MFGRQDRPVKVSALPARANRVRADLVMMCIDSVLVVLCFCVALLLRFDGQVPPDWLTGAMWFIPVAILVFLMAGYLGGLYGHIWRYASIHEARLLLLVGGAATVVLSLFTLLGPYWVPLSVVVGGAALTTAMMGATRFQSRLFARRRVEETPSGLRVVIVGAGVTGTTLARQMVSSPHSGLIPVAFVDDDPRLHGRRMLGIHVGGGTDTLYETLVTTEAHQVLLAVADADAELVRTVTDHAERARVAVRVLPSLDEIVRSGLRLQDVRKVQIDDLLGRGQIQTDLAQVAAMLRGKRVLITGAGGSIGSEIGRQVAAMGVAELLLLDHDETHLHEASASIDAPHETLLVDIRESQRLNRHFCLYRPEVVFHAAAHKHVPMLEDHPGEATRTNVLGTRNVLQAAQLAGTQSFVLISSDKAVNPSSVMGASKRIAEYLVVNAAQQSNGAYCAVRFGNVLGSRGSVIPTFVRQIEAGGPVTITDASMTRYFMSIPEAVQLVLQAAAMSERGEIFMLEMGKPVPIIELAKRMIRLSGRRVGTDIEVRVTGVRPGEKLHEELHTEREQPLPTAHPSIEQLGAQNVPQPILELSLRRFTQLSEADDELAIHAELLAFAKDPIAYRLADMPTVEMRSAAIDLLERESWSRSIS